MLTKYCVCVCVGVGGGVCDLQYTQQQHTTTTHNRNTPEGSTPSCFQLVQVVT